MGINLLKIGTFKYCYLNILWKVNCTQNDNEGLTKL